MTKTAIFSATKPVKCFSSSIFHRILKCTFMATDTAASYVWVTNLRKYYSSCERCCYVLFALFCVLLYCLMYASVCNSSPDTSCLINTKPNTACAAPRRAWFHPVARDESSRKNETRARKTNPSGKVSIRKKLRNLNNSS